MTAGDLGPILERVRIICVDRSGSVLLLKWRDPVDAHVFWEPPGGGIEAGEDERTAAVRELFEETGFESPISAGFEVVEREYTFAGRHHHHLEAFFLTHVDASPAPGVLTEEELGTYLDARFVGRDELAALDAPVQPPDLLAILRAMLD